MHWKGGTLAMGVKTKAKNDVVSYNCDRGRGGERYNSGAEERRLGRNHGTLILACAYLVRSIPMCDHPPSSRRCQPRELSLDVYAQTWRRIWRMHERCLAWQARSRPHACAWQESELRQERQGRQEQRARWRAWQPESVEEAVEEASTQRAEAA